MRRATSSLPSPVASPVALLVALTVAASLTVALPGRAAPASADDGARSGPPLARSTAAPLADSDGALARAARALGRERLGPLTADGRPAAVDRPEATLALRDLFLARPGLDGTELLAADRLLARPSDGAADPYGDGYTTLPTRTCSAKICVHHVRSGADAPPSPAWAAKTLRVMKKVWKHHVGTLGYRRPASDGGRGGSAKFDVYLAEIGDRGLYGYCAPERRVLGQPKQASGFCVLDDDFARAQFGRAPAKSLRVTAAHEFLHAIQFAYDFTEDQWLLESTATWVEERFADEVDDNRSYLKHGQAARPTVPLDLFDGNGLAHYGNWVFWEFLSEKYGNAIVREVIERTGTGAGLPDDYSTQGLRQVLGSRGGLTRLYAAFAAANTVPERSYAEGAAFPGVAPVRSGQLRASSPRTTFATRVDHLTSKTLRLRPSGLKAGSWRLRISVDTPEGATATAMSVVVRRDGGGLSRRTVTLGRDGRARRTVGFSGRSVRWVGVTLANASTRYACGTGSGFACGGRPLDQRQRFAVTARAVRG